MEVVILCGGKGTRAYPFSEYFPKVMMPVGGTPILLHLMRIYAQQGFTSFVLAVGHRKEIIYDYFNDRFSEWKVSIVDTGAESETGERIRRCLPYVGESFFATYGDGLGDVDLHSLKEFHEQSGGLATLTSVPLRSQYGTVHFDAKSRVDHFQEKPVIRDNWINAGFFVFHRSVFDLSQGQNLEADVLPVLAQHSKLYSYQHRGFWKSMDTSKDQQELEAFLGSGSPPWSIPISLKAASGRGR
jgi:glucose-1-phosphate cytidylyltransferase